MASQNRATRAKTRTTNQGGRAMRQIIRHHEASLTANSRPSLRVRARRGSGAMAFVTRAPRKTGEIRVATGEVRAVPHPGLVSHRVRSRLGRALMWFSDWRTSRPTPTDRRAPALFPREDGRSWGVHIPLRPRQEPRVRTVLLHEQAHAHRRQSEARRSHARSRRVRRRGPRHPPDDVARARAQGVHMLRPEIRARRGHEPGPGGVFVPGRVDANAAGDEYAPGTRRSGRRPPPRPRPGPGYGTSRDGVGARPGRESSPSPSPSPSTSPSPSSSPAFERILHRAAARRRRRRPSAAETASRRIASTGRRGARRATRRRRRFHHLRSSFRQPARDGTPGRRETSSRERSASTRKTRRVAGRLAKPPRRGFSTRFFVERIRIRIRIRAESGRPAETRTHARARIVRRAERVSVERENFGKGQGTWDEAGSKRSDETGTTREDGGGVAGSRRVRRRARRVRIASEEGFWRDERRRVHRRAEVRGGRSRFAGTGSVRSDDRREGYPRNARALRHLRRAISNTGERVLAAAGGAVVRGGTDVRGTDVRGTNVRGTKVLGTRSRGWWVRARNTSRAGS